MAKIEQRPTITLEATLTLDEREARALHTLSLYGTRAFLKSAENFLGETEYKRNVDGLQSLIDSARSQLAPILSRTNEARWVFTGERIAVPPPKESA